MKTEIYDALINALPGGISVYEVRGGKSWTAAKLSDGGVGIAAHFAGSCDFSSLSGLGIREAASLALSDDEETASAGMAVINAFYNSASRLRNFRSMVSCETFCTSGIDITGKTVGMIGHMGRTAAAMAAAEKFFIFELNPRDGDLPASEEEKLVPGCDLLIVTGSSLINHTLPRLLELASGADVILVGPTTPLCPELLSFGMRRLSGLVITRPEKFWVWNNACRGSPLSYGDSFLVGK